MQAQSSRILANLRKIRFNTDLPEYEETDPQLTRLARSAKHAKSRLSPATVLWDRTHWKPEVGSWIASFLFLVAIIIVLAVSDGKSLPRLPLGLSVNAVIGLLGTLMEFFLMVTVSSALGQTKWFRASRSRIPMEHFYLIDESSRGPWGSFKLLVRKAGG
jgi:hypothetical protein